MLTTTWIIVWILLTIATWWLPASVAFILLVVNLMIADPLPYTDEIIMLVIAFKQAIAELLKLRKDSQSPPEQTAVLQENLPSNKADKLS